MKAKKHEKIDCGLLASVNDRTVRCFLERGHKGDHGGLISKTGSVYVTQILTWASDEKVRLISETSNVYWKRDEE